MKRRMMNGCGCEYCASLHGVATVPVPAGAAIGAPRAEVVSMQTYRDWLDRMTQAHREFLARRFGEAFA